MFGRIRARPRKEDNGLGLPLETVQVRMGHSTLAMTADRYGHLFPSTRQAAGQRSETRYVSI